MGSRNHWYTDFYPLKGSHLSSIESIPFDFLNPREWKDYELLDSGDGRKLERFGKYILIRPEVEAIWKPAASKQIWQEADASFLASPEENGGHWQFHHEFPSEWSITYKSLRFLVRLSNSRHVGVFPEQASHWDILHQLISGTSGQTRVLNLFGYTGLASLAAVSSGAQVTHLDASRKAIAWARQNQELSGLNEKPIRWIVDDALKFVQREARRGSKYDGIVLDPPKFGRGPKGEVWEFYTLLPILLSACRELLTSNAGFIFLTAYAVKASSLTLGTALRELMQSYSGQVRCGELVLRDKSADRALSTAVYAIWGNSTFSHFLKKKS